MPSRTSAARLASLLLAIASALPASCSASGGAVDREYAPLAPPRSLTNPAAPKTSTGAVAAVGATALGVTCTGWFLAYNFGGFDLLSKTFGRPVDSTPKVVARQVDSELLYKAPFLFLHDAATGYMGSNDVARPWTQTQTVGFVDQLSCGARALDLRLLKAGDVIKFHHAGVPMLEQRVDNTVPGIVSWANEHPSELVLLMLSHCMTETSLAKNKYVDCDKSFTEPFKKAGVPVETSCNKINKMTLREAREAGKLTGGGAVLAVVDCINDNWDESITWTDKACPGGQPWQDFWNYISSSTSGKRAPDGQWTQLWETQAFWQETGDTQTLIHYDIIRDNERSDINKEILKKMSKDPAMFKGVNLFEINNVCAHGTAIAKALGTNVSSSDEKQCKSACGAREFAAPLCGVKCCQKFDTNCCGKCKKDESRDCAVKAPLHNHDLPKCSDEDCGGAVTKCDLGWIC